MTKDPGHTGLPPDFDSPVQRPIQMSEYLLISPVSGMQYPFRANGAAAAKLHRDNSSMRFWSLYTRVRE